MDKAVVEGIHKIANAMYKRNGYAESIKLEHTKAILEAAEMLDCAIGEHLYETTNYRQSK